MRRAFVVLTCLAMVVIMPGAVLAATLYWDGGTDTDWDTAGNWDTAANLAGGDPLNPPQIGDDVVIYKRNNQPVIPAGGTAGLAGVQFDTVTQAEGGAGAITLTCTGTLNMQAATAITLVDGGDNSVTISGAGGISGAGALGITNADAGGGTGGADMIIDATCPVATATATITVTVASTDDIVQMDCDISDGGVVPPAIGFDKVGPGLVLISGDNSNIDGQIDIHGGEIATTGANATVLGAGGVAAVFLTAGTTLTVGTAINAAAWVRTIQVDGNATIATNGQPIEIDELIAFTGPNTLTFSGDTDIPVSSVISDGVNTGNIAINMATSAERVTLSGANTYDGTTTITQGILLATNAASLGADTGNTTIGAAGTLELTGGITIPAAEDITANGGAPSTIVNVAGDNTIAAPIVTATAANKYEVAAGTLTISGVISGTQAVTKLGPNVLTLTGANSYDGLTTVSAGMLLVNAVMADANDGGLTVASGATLAGTGTIKSDVTVQDGGIVAPGDGGVGTLTTAAGTASNGDVTFQGASVLLVDLVNAAKDLFAVGGNLVLPVGTALVQLEAGYAWQGASDPYQVVTIAGTYNPAGGAVFQNTSLPNANWSVISNADTDIQLHFAIPAGVPTLGEWGLIIFALLLAGYTVMRMKSQRTMTTA